MILGACQFSGYCFARSSLFPSAFTAALRISRPFLRIGGRADKLPPSQPRYLAPEFLWEGPDLAICWDRFYAPRVASIIFGCAAAGMGLLRLATSQDFAFLAAFAIGLGLGAETDIMAYLTSRYFGLRSFGVIYGFMFAGFALAQGSGTYVMGAVFDIAGSYNVALIFFCIATLIGAGLMLTL